MSSIPSSQSPFIVSAARIPEREQSNITTTYTKLPEELMLRIFSHLNLKDIQICLQVCRNWRRIAKDPQLTKICVYNTAFSNAKWANYFGREAVVGESFKEEWDSLPWEEFIKDSKKLQSLYPEKEVTDRLVLVRIPKKLTLNMLGKLAERHFPENGEQGFATFELNLKQHFGDQTVGAQSCWVLMTKDILPESRLKSYNDQAQIINGLAAQSLTDYQVPRTLIAAACTLGVYVSNASERIFNEKTYTRCQEDTVAGRGDYSLVGNFGDYGLCLNSHPADSVQHGMAAMRTTFTPVTHTAHGIWLLI